MQDNEGFLRSASSSAIIGTLHYTVKYLRMSDIELGQKSGSERKVSMLESQRGLRLIVLAAIALCIVASMTGARAGDDKSGLRIAVVDMQKLNEDSVQVKGIPRRGGKTGQRFQSGI